MRAVGPVLIVASFALPAPAVHAESYLVLPDGSGDFPTIEAAIDSVSDGDEILLGSGTFSGPGNAYLSFSGKAITIRSAAGDAATVTIDCGSDTGFLFWGGEGAGSVLRDLTIANADGYTPGAIYSDGASPRIVNVVVRDSRGIWLVGGAPELDHVQFRSCYEPLYASGSSPTLTGCILESNTMAVTGQGGVLNLWGSHAVVDSCVIRNNRADGAGGISIDGGSPLLRDCIIVNNEGGTAGGILVTNATPTFQRCTVSRNAGAAGGIRVKNSSALTLEQTIAWGNCGSTWDEISLDVGSSLLASCSDLRLSGVGGGGTLVPTDVIDFAPMFCAPQPCGVPGPAGAYGVDEDSQVVLAACGRMGALAAECNIGVAPTSWGRLKALFR